jgi:hypothetical protein
LTQEILEGTTTPPQDGLGAMIEKMNDYFSNSGMFSEPKARDTYNTLKNDTDLNYKIAKGLFDTLHERS